MPQYRYERLRDEYAKLWASMRVVKGVEAARAARKVVAGKERYLVVEKRTGVPWFVVGCLHIREADGDFSTWLHNGDRMVRNGRPVKTVNVPAGRPPNPAVSWEDGAYDALVVCEHMDEIKDWCPERVAYAAELFNGWGYRSPARNIPSPYLWGGTSVQKPGKFIRDGVYDKGVMDTQIGAMAILKMIMEMDTAARFSAPAPQDEDVIEDEEPATVAELPTAPKARDGEAEVKPLTQSHTMWGGLGLTATSVLASGKGILESLHDPYTLGGFVALLAAAGVALYLVISGRLNVQKMVAHLSDDNTGAPS